MTQQDQAEEIVDAFEMFDNWEDRYRFLIDMGKKLPPLPEDAKNEENRVHGCQSNVWMIAEATEEGGNTKIEFIADSDSTIVRGLVAILRMVYSGQTPRDILEFDIDGLMTKLGLDQHLSLGRRNGLAGMVTRVKTLATQLA
ncbi:SufE family protein [bacterium]|nr:MAG: SufE family protein [bacterium]